MGGAGWSDRRVLDLFPGLEHPIVQAPMAGAIDVALAIAAARGGALASLPCALLSPEQVREQVGTFRAAVSGKPINLNFFCHRLDEQIDDSAWRAALAPFYAKEGVGPPATPPPLRRPFGEAQADLVEALRPEAVSFHFGLPDDALLERVRGSGARIIGNATSIAEARVLIEHSVDLIIAQGVEAGGHAGRFLSAEPSSHMGLMALVPQIADLAGPPVIAAGGIGDARGIAAALILGASAVQLGTAYLHTPESRIPAAHRAGLRGEAAERTVVTTLFTGGRARGLPNALIETLGPTHPDAPPFPHASAALAELRRVAEADGRGDYTSMWSGQAARLGRSEPAETLTRRLAAEARALLNVAETRSHSAWETSDHAP